MNRLFLFIVLVWGAIGNVSAQMKETFDSNSWQWTEQSSPLGKVYIIDGVLRFETETPTNIEWDKVAETLSSHAYLPFEPSGGFIITCDAFVNKVSDNRYFGLLLDYMDDMNFMCFTLSQNWALLCKISEGKITRKWKGQMHLPKQKKANINMKITYSGGDLEIRVDDIPAIHAKYAPIETSGFGFFAFGKTKVDFDNVEVTF